MSKNVPTPEINPTRLAGIPYCPMDTTCPSYMPDSQFSCRHWDREHDDIDSYVCFPAVREMAKALAAQEKKS